MPNTQTILGVPVTLEYLNTKDDDVRVGYNVGSTVKDIAQAASADVAMNFNFADNITGTPIGSVIVDSKTVNKDIAKTVPRDSFCIQTSGTFQIGKPNANTLHSVQGSPRLLDGGLFVINESIERDQTGTDIWANNAKRIRVAVGLLSPTKAIIVRTHTEITLHVLAQIMANLGCIDALNGDGGGSAYLWPHDNGWGRLMGSAITVKKGVYKMIGDTNPTLIIDPGHGGSDPGAGGNGIVEKAMTLAISLYQFNRFKELGVKVALTRDTDVTIDSTPRATIVKNSGAKYCISNHINAASATTAKGAEIIHSIHNDGKLAKAIASSLKAAGQVLRPTATFSKEGTKLLVDSKGQAILKNGEKQYVGNGQDYYFMHRQTGAVESNIIEYGFLTNAEDATRLQANWQKYAEAVVKAFCEFIGHKYVAPKGDVVIEVPAAPTIKKTVAYTDAKVVIDGKEVDVQGMNVNGTVWLPVRKISEPNGFSVAWKGEEQTVYLTSK